MKKYFIWLVRLAGPDVLESLMHREYVKLQSLMTRLVKKLSEVPAPVESEEQQQPTGGRQPRQNQGGENDGEIEDEAQEEQQQQQQEQPQQQQQQQPQIAPLKSMYLVPVCERDEDVKRLLDVNSSEPGTVDYGGVVAFAWYIETVGDSFLTLVDALKSILDHNSKRLNGAPPRKKGSPPLPAGLLLPPAQRAQLQASVCAVNGPAPQHDLQSCVFSLDHTKSEDWSTSFRDASDMAFMLETVLNGWSAGPDVGVDEIAKVFTRTVGGSLDSSSAEFFRIPKGACLPLRNEFEDFKFGMEGPGLVALEVRAQHVNFRKSAKVTRFPILREMSSDRRLAARDHVRFQFIKMDPPMLNAKNKEGVIKRLRIHCTEQLQDSCWDPTLIADEGTVLAERPDEHLPALGAPRVPDPQTRREVIDENERIRRTSCNVEGWWRQSGRKGDWELDKPYDVLGGPPCRDPDAGCMRLRMTALRTLGYMNKVTGAHICVEEYGRTETKTLQVTQDSEAIIRSETLNDPQSMGFGRKRGQTVFARVGRNAGPVWPSPDEWAPEGHHGAPAWPSSEARLWKPRRRLMWRADDGRLHAIVSVKIEYDRRTRGPRVELHSREVRGQRWLSVVANDDGQVIVPTTYDSRKRMMRRLEGDAEQAFQCNELLSDSYVRSFKWFKSMVEKYKTERKPRGCDFVHPNLNGHMNHYASFLLMMEYCFDIRYYHPQTWKCYLGFKHTSKTAAENTKPLHHILFGPPGEF